MPSPHNTINVPKDQQILKTVLLLHQNIVNIRAVDATTNDMIKIGDKEFITLTPSRNKPKTLNIYHVPSAGMTNNQLLCLCLRLKILCSMLRIIVVERLY